MSDPNPPERDSSGSPRRVAFVCYGNACRSQMAEAYARDLGDDVIDPASAGIHPLGSIPPEVAEVMHEEDITIDGQFSKAMHELGRDPVDLIVDLTGSLQQSRDGVPILSKPIPDPYGGSIEDYRETREAAKQVVVELIEGLRGKDGA